MTLTDEDLIELDGNIFTFAELEAILRSLCLNLVRAGQTEVQIEHAEHLTLQ